MRSNFRDVAAYARAFELANDMYWVVKRWPHPERRDLGDQLLRALDSVGANLAEGLNRWHPKDRRHFFIVARASMCEAEHWLVTAEARQLLTPGTHERLEGIARPLAGLIRKEASR